jgi:signal transduction histidine kinase
MQMSPVAGYGCGMRLVQREGLRANALDISLALALTVISQISIWTGTTNEGPKGITVPVALAVTTGLAWRRSAPLATTAVLAGAWLFQAVVARSPSATWELVVLLIYAYSLAAHTEQRQAVAGGLGLLAAMWVIVLLDPTQEGSGDLFTAPVLVGLPWLAGRVVRRYSAQARELDVLNMELERRREHDLREAQRDERTRIARELHDVVAHSLSVMVVQAGAAEEVLAHDPQSAAEPLAAIRQTGKNALLEMRRLLGVLKTDADGLALTPQPGLGDLGDLVEQMRAAGVDVRLEVDDDLPALTPGADLAAYRVVQEALTNVLKHAGKVPADVRVGYAEGSIDIDVVNGGGSGDPPNGRGHGLIGMRERVALYGGSVAAGPADGGGWRVHARLSADETRERP